MDVIITSHQTHQPGIESDAAALAKRYCALIEAASRGQGQWLAGVAQLLPRLHAAVASVEAGHDPVSDSDPVDLDARFELFTRLRVLLGDRDSYWLEFDCAAEGAHEMTGSLADDLTDIYCELKQGLRLYASDPHRALVMWASGYVHHWGQHLIDAERHLAALGAQSRLAL